MTDTNDDFLVQRFLTENQRDIADNGFSKKVMRHIPNHNRRISTLWSIGCLILAAILFYILGGAHLMLESFRESFNSAIHNEATGLDPKSLIMVVVVLLYLGYRKLCTLA